MKKAYLEIPNEALKNENAKLLLYKFSKLCFNCGLNPTEWDKNDIKPIPKKDKDQRDPLQNRCITIMCCVAKIYSSILTNRLHKTRVESVSLERPKKDLGCVKLLYVSNF